MTPKEQKLYDALHERYYEGDSLVDDVLSWYRECQKRVSLINELLSEIPWGCNSCGNGGEAEHNPGCERETLASMPKE